MSPSSLRIATAHSLAVKAKVSHGEQSEARDCPADEFGGLRGLEVDGRESIGGQRDLVELVGSTGRVVAGEFWSRALVELPDADAREVDVLAARSVIGVEDLDEGVDLRFARKFLAQFAVECRLEVGVVWLDVAARQYPVGWRIGAPAFDDEETVVIGDKNGADSFDHDRSFRQPVHRVNGLGGERDLYGGQRD
jgi:hypothetical protein